MLFVSLASASTNRAHATPSKAVTGIPSLSVLDAIVRDAIHDDQIPGAILLVWHNGQVIYRKAFGNRALEPRREAMTLDTIFDIASLTKVVATTTAVMQLVQEGEVRLNDPVAKYMPEFAQNGKDDITVRNLLTHFSGLRADIDLTPPWEGRDAAMRLAFAETPAYPPGSAVSVQRYQFHRRWGRWSRSVSGTTLDAILRQENLRPIAHDAHSLSASGGLAAQNRSD